VILSTISQTKNRLSELLASVQEGETLIIMDRKTPVARVERIRTLAGNPNVQPPRRRWNAEAVLDLPLPQVTGCRLVEAVNEERGGGR